ncbi:MAG: hypothetical protein F2681_15660 [Actinobacteria bacterium]|jgi:hypothetical protein|uniref:Unannotated protein n=1 Tax=freshwater metagenome TaxID=449393 RepID=A0A6J7QFN1_9ZZZZ|nr:hypothetical protein [Actinomycetota bacterium]MSW78815.1 hypothetical protein [Actinomycetota bacterium]MSX55269.1 hypothetical protein [Actinomycetota bacterium]MSZ84567.1 hypothetical protein [Actinomycetota bacterium]MTB19297.1 hypothetical protein [Actinomycetota bacterium]
MATTKKRTTKSIADGLIAADDTSPSATLAREILADYSDLTPSVMRIVSADLSEGQRQRALEQFRNSLGAIDDPNRDPRYAIANCGPAEH